MWLCGSVALFCADFGPSVTESVCGPRLLHAGLVSPIPSMGAVRGGDPLPSSGCDCTPHGLSRVAQRGPHLRTHRFRTRRSIALDPRCCT